MKLHYSMLKQPKGVIKLPEILLAIVCLVLQYYVCLRNTHEIALAFITCVFSLIITPCILLVNLAVVEEEPRPYLEAALNLITTGLYMSVSGIVLGESNILDGNHYCFKQTVALGAFSLLNMVVYALDSYITIKVLHDSTTDTPPDILQKF